MKASVFVATSLDGFVARTDHQLDWLEQADSDATTDFGYERFIRQVTTIVMGRKTFEKVLSFPEWPYSNQRLIVLSSTLTEVPAELADSVQLFNGDVRELATLLDSEGEQHLYVDGTHAIRDFISAGLMTDLIITTIPILIGDGIALFHHSLTKDKPLKHISTDVFSNGFVQTHYSFL